MTTRIKSSLYLHTKHPYSPGYWPTLWMWKYIQLKNLLQSSWDWETIGLATTCLLGSYSSIVALTLTIKPSLKFLSKRLAKHHFDKCKWIWDWAFKSFFSLSSSFHKECILSKPKSVLCKSIWIRIYFIFTCHSGNLVFRSHNEISYFIEDMINHLIKYSQQTNIKHESFDTNWSKQKG